MSTFERADVSLRRSFLTAPKNNAPEILFPAPQCLFDNVAWNGKEIMESAYVLKLPCGNRWHLLCVEDNSMIGDTRTVLWVFPVFRNRKSVGFPPNYSHSMKALLDGIDDWRVEDNSFSKLSATIALTSMNLEATANSDSLLELCLWSSIQSKEAVVKLFPGKTRGMSQGDEGKNGLTIAVKRPLETGGHVISAFILPTYGENLIGGINGSVLKREPIEVHAGVNYTPIMGAYR